MAMHTQPVPAVNTWTLISQNDHLDLPRTIVITPPFRIGRREGFDLIISCRNVSGLHAEILEKEGVLWIYDLNSTNGTFVNGNRIESGVKLKAGDTLQFGSSTFEVELSVSGRRAMATLENFSPEAAESPEERFHRLLDSGASPVFQPIFDISDIKLSRVGFEVLGRSSLFGLSTPDQMFSAAKDLDREAELSRVLRLRGFEVADKELQADQIMFVNTHPSELEHSSIIESLKEVREEYPNREIVIELPESFLDSHETIVELNAALNDLEIKLAIYDFGAGQIRLSELNKISPEIVKFAGALVQGIGKADEKQQRLISAMVKMTTEMGISPMAEFVENEEDHKVLQKLGMKYAQGFYYGRPVDISLAKRPHTDSELSTPPELSNADPNTSDRKQEKELGHIDQSRPIQKLKSLEGLESIEKEVDKCEAEFDDQADGKDGKSAVLDNPKVNEKGTDWLLSNPGSSFTVQLMTFTSEKWAREFLAKLTQEGDYSLYTKKGRFKVWYVIVYGVFENRNDAKDAAKFFKNTGVSSWVRRLSAIHSEINAIEEESV